MSKSKQRNNILLAVLGFCLAAILVGTMGYFFLGTPKETIQGELDADSYRVSCKLPGRVERLFVKEGDYVHVGDTLAIIRVPEVSAQEKVAQAAGDAATAISDMTNNGARREQVQAAYQLYRQAMAAAEITQKTFRRVDNLFNEGVVSQQKRDEAKAAADAAAAQVAAAKEQWKMAQDGARAEEKRAAAKQAQAARSAVGVVQSLLTETVQVSPVEGEVGEVYPMEGELLGMGSPIMSIDLMSKLWGTFNVREDQLKAFPMGKVVNAYMPAFGKRVRLKVYNVKDAGSYAVWKATKSTGQYDLKTFEVKARPLDKIEGMRPGMSLVVE